MKVTVHQAKAELSELLDALENGEQVIIARGQQQLAELVPLRRRKFKHGILKDKLKGPTPDFLEPMSEEELRLWEGGD